MTTNHTSMIGPKNAATLAVPRDWNANSSTRISAVSGTTYGSNAGVTTLRPSIAESTDNAGASMLAQRALRQCHQRERAALAVVVGAQQDDDVFERDDENECPNNERQNAENDGFAGGITGADRRHHGFAHGIEGARADVAVDDADRPQRERPETGPRTRVGAAFARNHGSLNGGNLGPRVFACYLGHGGRVNPDASQNGRRLISPLTLPERNMPRRDKFRARDALSHDQQGATSPWNASGRDVPVLFLEKPEPGVHIAVGHLEQARRPAAALVNDPVALRQCEDVPLVPSDGVISDLAFAGALHHAAHG